MEDKELKSEGAVRMVFEGIEISRNPFEQSKLVYKAMGKYGEDLATKFAIFISREGWMKMSNSEQWIKISTPTPSFTIQEVYKFFLDNL